MISPEPQAQVIVVGRAGLRGRIVGRENEAGPEERVIIQLDQGERLVVSPALLTRREDGGYDLPLAPNDLPASQPGSGAPTERVIPLAQEELRIGKVINETKVRVKIAVREREETIDLPLRQEDVSVERVPVNRVVDQPPPVREEDDVIIVPLLEEVVWVQKKLMVREEVRIHRQSSETHHRQRVTLRREEAEVEREPQPQRSSSAGTEPGTESSKESS